MAKVRESSHQKDMQYQEIEESELNEFQQKLENSNND